MSVKDQVLELLEAGKGNYFSGEEIASRLSVSRNSVWKAVAKLKEEGHNIYAVTNRGYCLSPEDDVLSLQSIERCMDGVNPFDITVYETVDSTNAELKRLASAGAREGKVIAAVGQTQGRGRAGRSFYSPSGTGAYFSLLLRPSFGAAEASCITTAAAVATAEVIEAETGCEAGIKWVNDVFCGGRKVCGILTEASFDMESGGFEYAVLGIGVNVSKPEGGFPEEIAKTAGSVAIIAESGPGLRARLIAGILKAFWKYYRQMPEKPFLETYRNKSIITGKDVLVLSGTSVRPAKALSIDDDCRLIVRFEDGKIGTLSSGEVSIRLPEGDKQ